MDRPSLQRTFFLILFSGLLAEQTAASPLFGPSIYGEFFTDENGLPAFAYTFDELNDPRSPWPNSEDEERRDHFQLFGNRRLNAMAVDYGYVSLFSNDRGPTWLNHFDQDDLQLGGGFSYLRSREGLFCSAHLFAPEEAEVTRTFGAGYFQNSTTVGSITVTHTLFAPEGDDPLLIDRVELINRGSTPLPVSHVEYFDVNHHQIATEWVRSGDAADKGDAVREAINRLFIQTTRDEGEVLIASMSPRDDLTPPPREAMSSVDFYPPDVFLAALQAPVDAVYTDQSLFFGLGTADHPDAVDFGDDSSLLLPTSASGQRAMLAIRSDLELLPSVPQTLTFAYGYLPDDWDLSMLHRYREMSVDALYAESAEARKAGALSFSAPHVPDEVAEEALWRSIQFLDSTVRLEYYGTHVTPQGSAYLYLHGADGAPRDQALFTLPAVYLEPSLARDNLRLIMGVTDARTGAITYSFTGHGINEAAYIHRKPSDLDLFFLMALLEYLGATGDLAFLSEEVPFHPRGSQTLPPGALGETVLDHARAAFTHLRDSIGLGPHGLLRIQDGDWSDGVVYHDPSPRAVLYTLLSGESIPNSQMALVLLPPLSGWLKTVDPTLSASMNEFAGTLSDAVRKTFTSRWFGRAWMRDQSNRPYLLGNDWERDPFLENHIDLEAQPWGLLSEVLSEEERERLLDEIEARLDDDSPIGPRLVEGGQVWPAISGLMTWAYARYRPEAGWNALKEHLYATHSSVFPEVWMGTLSGPDGFVSSGGDGEGGTWSSAMTPMSDFPVSNMNPDALWLLSLIRLAGIEPRADGLSLSPRGEGDTFRLSTRLLQLDVSLEGIDGVYRADRAGQIVLRVSIPEGSAPDVAIAGVPISPRVEQGQVLLPLDFDAAEELSFTVLY